MEELRSVLKVPDSFACADCGMPITKLWDWEKLYKSKDLDGPCPDCGRPDLITDRFRSGTLSMRQANCHGCELPALGAISRTQVSNGTTNGTKTNTLASVPPISSINMVGARGFEPRTPTVSRQGRGPHLLHQV
jgi:hypothetical protein